ncbi:MAG: 16S rRNA (cytosine(1402)-N(4))-methyltransferase RsmH [Candidatus Niyogibacteria bacterium]|nr:16S rRNA (cytosine(1402)-N(4))-methyltransferase RsmH [Candidatus Niyogibacteria bacterium]
MAAHEPVLLKETIKFLRPELGRAFVDATVDGGGHAREILKAMAKNAVLVGIDRDAGMLDRLKKELGGERRLKLVQGNFRNLAKLAHKFSRAYDGVLFDFGLSSIQLESSGRGFSFLKDEPLLMTYAAKPKVGDLTAALIVNSWPEEEVSKIIWQYGEERFARRIARTLAEERKKSKILTTEHLVRIIKKATPAWYHKSRIHPATKTFQALRIAVNDELDSLKEGLESAWGVLKPKGRLVVISFHSLEDRIVKNFLRDKKNQAEILTKKPISPSGKEISANPRARSAKMRAAIKK